jgi:DNA-binding NtrC family response regulator
MAKILVIDDSAMMRLYLRRCLEKAGFEVEDWLPLSAMEIGERLEAMGPDLILTDYQMAGCNGVTVARMARKSNPKMPIIVITAFRNLEIESSLERFGVRTILDKPVSAELLVQAVKDALETPFADEA